MDADIAELLPVLEAQTEQTLHNLETNIVGIRKARLEMLAPTFGTGPEVARQEEITIPGPGGPIPLRVFVPKEKVRGAYLFIHGGGWCLGSEKAGDPVHRRTASESGLAVVSVGYRLAPEHPYPAGLDDCMAAAAWLEQNTEALGVTDPEALGIGGESAGANLAAAVLLRRRDEGELPLRAAVLTFGVFTLELDLPSMKEMWDRKLVLSGPIMQYFVDAYASGRSLRHPYISPLFADLKGMPPAIFSIGTLDHLYSDTIAMANAWHKAGNIIELREYPGAPHGFVSQPIKAADEAQTRIIEFLQRNVARHGGRGETD